MDSIRPLLKPTQREDSGMFRFDQRFTDNTTMFVRYNIDDLLKLTPGVMGAHADSRHSPAERRGPVAAHLLAARSSTKPRSA